MDTLKLYQLRQAQLDPKMKLRVVICKRPNFYFMSTSRLTYLITNGLKFIYKWYKYSPQANTYGYKMQNNFFRNLYPKIL